MRPIRKWSCRHVQGPTGNGFLRPWLNSPRTAVDGPIVTFRMLPRRISVMLMVFTTTALHKKSYQVTHFHYLSNAHGLGFVKLREKAGPFVRRK